MVNNRDYFVFAVIIAYVVPVFFASIYLSNMYSKLGKTNYVALLDGNEEITLVGDTQISSQIDASSCTTNEGAYTSEFLLMYSKGSSDKKAYSISLGGVNIYPSYYDDYLTWKLYKYSDENLEYELYTSGMIDAYSEDDYLISSEVVLKGEAIKYKLYLCSDSNEDIKLNANLVLE